MKPTEATPTTDAAAHYAARLDHYTSEYVRLTQRSHRAGNFNLLLFFCAFAVIAAGAFSRSLPVVLAGALLSAAFVAGLVAHNRIGQRLHRTAVRSALAREGLARMERRWSDLPAPPTLADTDIMRSPGIAAAASSQIDLATAADLDLLGYASLEQLLGAPNTPVGKTTLRRWILEPAAPAVARERQQCAAELAAQVDFREEAALRGRQFDADPARYARFVDWAEGESWLHAHRLWLWVARLLPLAALALFVALLAGYPVWMPLLAVMAVNLAVLQTVGRRAGEDIQRAAAQQGVFAVYASIFELFTAHPMDAARLARLQQQLHAGDLSADRQMRRLARLMPLVDIRRSIYFFPIEVATLWSFHVLWLLEGWQRAAGGSVRAWLDALGEAEALIALATLHFENPAWVFPDLDDAPGRAPGFVAASMAHPLLPPARAIGNDVTIGPPGSYLLVTGSNMSGKSTLLRAVGVNVVLAQMGAPVCAAALHLPPLAVISCMRVRDSLEAGVSFYMAELRRLKEVVDAAHAHGDGRGVRLLYLLDEILQGTNTAERQIAARHIIRRLIECGALGAVSTHDLTLADAPELKSSAHEVYFTEHFTRGADGPTMTFDYILRPGIAISTNALKLMELVGLPVGDETAD